MQSLLSPAPFLHAACDIHKVSKKQPVNQERYRLGDQSSLTGSDFFADLYMGWSEEALFVRIEADDKKILARLSGDFFFDTRDVKTAGMVHKYCHRFHLTPSTICETTTFRSEDKHPLCAPEDIEIHRDKTCIELILSRQCLHGYDPSSISRMGFTYILEASGRLFQSYNFHPSEVAIENHPSLWSTVHFID